MNTTTQNNMNKLLNFKVVTVINSIDNVPKSDIKLYKPKFKRFSENSNFFLTKKQYYKQDIKKTINAKIEFLSRYGAIEEGKIKKEYIKIPYVKMISDTIIFLEKKLKENRKIILVKKPLDRFIVREDSTPIVWNIESTPGNMKRVKARKEEYYKKIESNSFNHLKHFSNIDYIYKGIDTSHYNLKMLECFNVRTGLFKAKLNSLTYLEKPTPKSPNKVLVRKVQKDRYATYTPIFKLKSRIIIKNGFFIPTLKASDKLDKEFKNYLLRYKKEHTVAIDLPKKRIIKKGHSVYVKPTINDLIEYHDRYILLNDLESILNDYNPLLWKQLFSNGNSPKVTSLMLDIKALENKLFRLKLLGNTNYTVINNCISEVKRKIEDKKLKLKKLKNKNKKELKIVTNQAAYYIKVIKATYNKAVLLSKRGGLGYKGYKKANRVGNSRNKDNVKLSKMKKGLKELIAFYKKAKGDKNVQIKALEHLLNSEREVLLSLTMTKVKKLVIKDIMAT